MTPEPPVEPRPSGVKPKKNGVSHPPFFALGPDPPPADSPLAPAVTSMPRPPQATPPPREVPEMDAAALSALESQVVTADSPDEIPLTDWGNAQRVIARYGSEIRWHAKMGSFLSWTGNRWIPDMRGAVMRYARSTMRALASSVDLSGDDGKVSVAVRKWCKTADNNPKLEAMVRLLKVQDGVTVLPEDLDSDLLLFQCQNVTIDLRTGEARPPRREDLITKSSPVVYDPAATCPRWLRFLEECQPNEEIRVFLQRLAGYAMTGSVSEEKFPIFYGLGRNGKSVFVNTLLRIWGDYGNTVPTELIMAKKFEAHPVEKTTLLGVRLASVSETEQGRELNVALVKKVTGGDPIDGRYMYGNPFTFDPTHKLILSTNHRPAIRETAHAIWDRVLLVGWDVSFAGREDFGLKDRLTGELSGILNWALEGCMEYREKGLQAPDCVRAATKSYREDEDVFADFLAACCDVDPEPHTVAQSGERSGELVGAYRKWALDNGYRPLAAKRVCCEMRDRSFPSSLRDGRTVWYGLTVRQACRPPTTFAPPRDEDKPGW